MPQLESGQSRRCARRAAGKATAVRSGVVLACAVGGALTGCHSEPSPTPVQPSTSLHTAHVATTAPTTAPSESSRTVATVNGIVITQSDLYQPLIESYGLTMLQNVMLLKLARQVAAESHVVVTPSDVQAERAATLAGLFPDATPADYAGLLDQFLRTKNLSAVQFDMLIETNANLRKVTLLHMPVFTDDQLRIAFGQRYGENRIVHDIQVPNMAEAAVAKRRVDSGEPFEQVAKDMSDNPRTRANGGQLPPFSHQAPNVPTALKDMAFSLKVGAVSDPVQDGTEYHILRLDAIIPPKVVKFEDVKADVRKMLEDTWTRLEIDQLRNQLAQRALRSIHIDDPALAAQWQQMLDRQNKQRDRDEVRQEISREHADTASTATSGTTAALRPPATMPGAASAAPGTPPAVSK